jgi:hypothetical protein
MGNGGHGEKGGEGGRSAVSVIANAGREGAEAWRERVRVKEGEDEGDQELKPEIPFKEIAEPEESVEQPEGMEVDAENEGVGAGDSDEELEDVIPSSGQEATIPRPLEQPETTSPIEVSPSMENTLQERKPSRPTVRLRVGAIGHIPNASPVPTRTTREMRGRRRRGSLRSTPEHEEMDDAVMQEEDKTSRRTRGILSRSSTRDQGGRKMRKQAQDVSVDTPRTRSLRSRAPQSAQAKKE